MAESICLGLEHRLTKLEDMERVKLFDRNEIRKSAKKRKRLEKRLRRRTKKKENFLQYIEGNPESDDPQFPGVTDINPKTPRDPYYLDEEEEEKEIKMFEIEEDRKSPCEDQKEEIEESEMDKEEIPTEVVDLLDLPMPLLCRSVRIGSYKVIPFAKTLNVYLAKDGIFFYAPVVSNALKLVCITVRPSDIIHMMGHFGKCLPMLFIFTTEKFAKATQRVLQMDSSTLIHFDPNSKDEKTEKLTFLIDIITEDQCRFLRYKFLNRMKVTEIDQKTANEILVKSTPSNDEPTNSHALQSRYKKKKKLRLCM